MSDTIEDIRKEYERAKKEFGGLHDDGHSYNDWIGVIVRYLGDLQRASEAANETNDTIELEEHLDDARDALVCVGGLVVSAIEAHDRNAPRRLYRLAAEHETNLWEDNE